MVKTNDHFLRKVSEAAAGQIALMQDAVTNYLKGGLMPLERPATEEEQLQAWRAMTPEQAVAEIQQSPKAFLAKWKHMMKLEAKEKASQPPPPPFEMLGRTPDWAPMGEPTPEAMMNDPLAPYMQPYGMDPSMAAGPMPGAPAPGAMPMPDGVQPTLPGMMP